MRGVPKWGLKIQDRGKEERKRQRGRGETGTYVFYHSKDENVSLFALRLMYFRNYPSLAKCEQLSS